MINIIDNYFCEIYKLVSTIDADLIYMIKNELFHTINERNTIYIIGNGISSATSEHLANDLAKKASENIVNRFGFRINAITLNEPMSFLSAIANDMGLEDIFVETLKKNSKENDVLFILSSSKPHTNILKAVLYAKQKGIKTISITGVEPGGLEQFSNINYCIESSQIDLVENIFLFLCHYLAEALNEDLKKII